MTLGLAGAGLMAIGAVSPWTQTWPSSVAADGGLSGGLLVLLAAALLVPALLIGRRRLALSLASASAAWIVSCMYMAPGSLVDQGALEAKVAYGAYVALVGALLAIGATAWEPRARRRVRLGAACSRSRVSCSPVSPPFLGWRAIRRARGRRTSATRSPS
jgi:peptidoglycan/LPS O-acetylase OafA/YrhL